MHSITTTIATVLLLHTLQAVVVLKNVRTHANIKSFNLLCSSNLNVV